MDTTLKRSKGLSAKCVNLLSLICCQTITR